MSRTAQSNRRERKNLLSKARWVGYAAAGAAAALGAHESADAGIFYSGLINQKVDGPAKAAQKGDFGSDSWNIPGKPLRLSHRGYYFNSSVGDIGAAVALGNVRGFTHKNLGSTFTYASRFKGGDLINAAASQFVSGGLMASYFGWTSSRFLGTTPEDRKDYIGFSFDAGSGTQYGWVQVKMVGAPDNAFTVVDYAYAGVDEPIHAGEVPEPGSLGLLATGAIGLLLWRRKRRASKSAA
jgi:hypothetical protein